MQFWNELEGRVIHGRHPLTRLVRSEGRTAWFESEAGDPAGTPATISLIEALTDADEVTERLQAAQSLQQPNLVSISKVGQVTLDDTLFVYAVMDHIEQSLADVLQGQALSADEGREVAESLVAALTAIHQKGWSHGHVEAASVLATETAVQLRSDCLQLNPAAQADDVAGIGVTLFHAFTQRKALTATDAQVNRIPAPFAEIVRNTFARRWTLAQVANALKPAPIAPPVAAPAAAPVVTPQAPPTSPPARAPEPRPVPPPVAPAPAPAARLEPLPPQAEKFESGPEAEPTAAAQRKPFLLYSAISLVVLAVLGFFLFRPHTATEPAQQAAAPAPTTPSTPATVPVAPAPTAKPSAVTKPSPVAKSSVARPTPVATAQPTPGNGRSIWRVIAYTYRYEKPAQEMVDKLKAQHPNLDVAVFSPAGKTTVYLISLGGAMTHEEALKMKDKAASMGLPPDTFVQNFSE
jgi:eukaryotic-like serine/threonine-protein kinase